MIYQKLKQVLPKNPTIIEIGAHIGTDTRKLQSVLRPAIHICVEPDPRNISRLRRSNNIEIVKRAISNHNGEAAFYVSGGKIPHSKRVFTDASSLMQPTGNIKLRPWMRFNKRLVRCITLDTLVANYKLGHIDLIWMDVQGAELLAFEGGEETLKETGYIYTECQEGRYKGQPGLNGILNALPGWKVILANGDNVLLENFREVK
jgi:FkbM family methyltransferase